MHHRIAARVLSATTAAAVVARCEPPQESEVDRELSEPIWPGVIETRKGEMGLNESCPRKRVMVRVCSTGDAYLAGADIYLRGAVSLKLVRDVHAPAYFCYRGCFLCRRLVDVCQSLFSRSSQTILRRPCWVSGRTTGRTNRLLGSCRQTTRH